MHKKKIHVDYERCVQFEMVEEIGDWLKFAGKDFDFLTR